jgi:integral membrane protein (TIGR01906 family)
MRALGLLILGLILFGMIAWRAGWLSDFCMALSWGGWATIGVVITILIFVAISFRQLFTAFHRVFFEGDTWLFSMSDSLIRLLPLRLWQDGFIAVGLITVLLALLFGIFGRKLSDRLSG